MGLLTIVFAIAFLLISVVVILSFFGDQISQIQDSAQERLNKQNDIADIRDSDDANVSTNSQNVCDLRITFQGIMNDRDLEFFSADASFFNDERFVYIDNDQGISNWEILTGQPKLDPVNYEWFCDFVDPISALSWSIRTSNDLTPFEFVLGEEQTNAEIIRFKFFLESKTDAPKRGFDFDGIGLNEPFQGSQTLPIGSEFPYNYQYSVMIEGITHDHYTMDFWNEDFSVNNRSVNFHFTEDICRAGFATCD